MEFIKSMLPAIEHFYMLGYWIVFFLQSQKQLLGLDYLYQGQRLFFLWGLCLPKDIYKDQLVGPRLGNNFFGDMFFTDGEFYLIYLK